MVFGWKKKREASASSERPSEPPRQVGVDEIAPLLEDLCKTRRKSLAGDAGRTLKDVRSKMDRILDIVAMLESEKLTEDDTDKHISAIVERGRSQVITVIKKAANMDTDVRTHGDAIRASRELARVLKIIGDVLGRQTRVIHIFAKKYALQLKSTLSELNSISDELAKSVRGHESFEAGVEDVLDKISKLREHRANVAGTAGNVAEMARKMDSHRKDAEAAGARIAELEASPEFAEHKKVAEAAGRLEAEYGALDRRIAGSFARVSRPLSKYIYVTSLDKAKKAVMQAMLDSPVRALQDAGPDEIADILTHVRKAVSSGTVSVKDVPKSEEYVDAVTAELGAHHGAVLALDAKKAELESKLRGFDSSRLDSERARRSLALDGARTLELRIKEAEADGHLSESEIPSVMRAIESKLRAVTSVAYTLGPAQ